jgi:hypothetical protein
MPFDIEGAKKAGYSDAEIADHLAQGSGFDIAAARKSGYSDSELLSHLSSNQTKYQDPNSDIPQVDANGVPLPNRPAVTKESPLTLTENPVVGGIEALGGAVLGGAAGLAGQIAGTVKGIGQSVVDGTYGTQAGANSTEDTAAGYAQSAAAPFMPRTETGREYLQAVGEVAEPLAGLAPLREAAIIGQTARLGAPAAGATFDSASALAKDSIQAAASKTSDYLKSPDSSDIKSMGAAQADPSIMRREMAAQLPVDPQLTEGQATRDFNQQRFEQEAMKSELGEPLRQRAAQQHVALRQSIDSWLDDTGAEAPDIRATGIAIDKAIREKSLQDKSKIRAAYKTAEQSGELSEPVNMANLVDSLNSSRSAESTAPVLNATKKELVRLGGAIEDEQGNLIPSDMTLGNTEQLRKFINKVTGDDSTNINFARELKGVIDTTTKESGGDVYRQARRLREKYARQYEDRAVISDLLSNKRGTADRKVALEDVFDRIVFRGSLDDARFARRVLQTGGESGQQAWKEVQGAGLRYIRDEATKNISRDVNGNEMISPAGLNKAINRLDADGKLDFIYGKNGAEKIRAINDIAKVLFTSPPGSVNTSNTAGVLLAALDMAVSGTAGLPLPIASGVRFAVKNIKDRKLKAKIQAALGDSNKEKKI